MRKAEAVWVANKTESTTISLAEQLDYYGKLTSQFPIASLRVVYARSGMHQASVFVDDPKFVIDFALYWMDIKTQSEGQYLTTIFNSEKTRSLIEQFQSKGLWGARDFAKVMFNLPIPLFNAALGLHTDLAQAAGEAESVAASVALDEGMVFTKARRIVRDALADAGISQRIDGLVAKLLGA